MRTPWSSTGTSGFRPSTPPEVSPHGVRARWRAETPPDFGPGVFVFMHTNPLPHTNFPSKLESLTSSLTGYSCLLSP